MKNEKEQKKNDETDSEPSLDEESISSEQNKNDDESKDQEDDCSECAYEEVVMNIGNTIEDNVVNPSTEDAIDNEDNDQKIEHNDNHQNIEDSLEDEHDDYEASTMSLPIENQICEIHINNVRLGAHHEYNNLNDATTLVM